MVIRLTSADQERVTAAVTAAELTTNGEIVTIVARSSDDYHDVASQWTVMAMLLALAVLATWPGIAVSIHARVAGGWGDATSPSALYLIALVVLSLVFLLVRFALAWRPLRLALTPAATRERRTRRRAVMLFRTAAEQRTRAATGVLLYLSLDEHRAEIIADEAIHSRVAAETWGEAMALLIEAVRDGRAGDGMADAVMRIGAVLAEHFPRSADDTNELPDRVIEL